MKIVLLESLGVPEEVLNACAKPLTDARGTPSSPIPGTPIPRCRSPAPGTPTSS